MDIDSLPRRRYTDGPTALQEMPRLSAELGGPPLLIKRDDQLGLALGGNKTRKLEFLIADALAQGADTLVTAGGVQSNHCRLTLAAARVEGLQCHLVLEEDLGADGKAVPGGVGANPPEHTGNYLLFDLMGADSVSVHEQGADLVALMEETAERLRAEGRTPYVIPVGGSSTTGALGYVDCARELVDQLAHAGADGDALTPQAIIVPSGSAGMQAGLIVGLHALAVQGVAAADIPVIGINVSRPGDQQEPKVRDLVDALAEQLGLPPVPAERTVALGDWVGPGYALPSAEMIEAVRLFARTEGIILDPVYTGKAAAGLVGQVRAGALDGEGAVVMIHSGGVPGLFARTAAFA